VPWANEGNKGKTLYSNSTVIIEEELYLTSFSGSRIEEKVLFGKDLSVE
jgi:hypothetical protein